MHRTEIERRFTYHPPTTSQVVRYGQIREAAKQFALLINEMTPASREQALALTHLDSVVMFANAAIARNEPSEADQMGMQDDPGEVANQQTAAEFTRAQQTQYAPAQRGGEGQVIAHDQNAKPQAPQPQ